MEKILVTNNEFNEICKVAASKYWNNFKKYSDELDKYEVLPFEVDTNNKQLANIINDLCNVEEKREHKTLYRGKLSHDNIWALKEKFNLETLTDQYYLVVLVNKDLNLVFDYCEGDITFSICDGYEGYKKDVNSYIDFVIDNYDYCNYEKLN